MTNRQPLNADERREDLTDAVDQALLDGLILVNAVNINEAEQFIATANKRMLKAQRRALRAAQTALAGGASPAEASKRVALILRRAFEQEARRTQSQMARAGSKHEQELRKQLSRAVDDGIDDGRDELRERVGGLRPGNRIRADRARSARLAASLRVVDETMNRWFRLESERVRNEVRRSLRRAEDQGSSIPQAVRDLRQRMDISRARAATLIRSGLQGSANERARRLYAKNRRVINGMQWIATLDDRTCPECGPLDGQVYWFDGRSPEASTMPTIPLHPNCRCFPAPVVRGLSRPEETPRWNKWILRQPRSAQVRALGVWRTDLLRAGDVAPRDFRGSHGRLRTRRELDALATRRRAA